MNPSIDTATGEVFEFDRAAAERRAERITLRLDAIAENYTRVLPLIREAIEKRDDIALGYRSPGDYVSDRFGQSLAGLGIGVRRAVVGELTNAGMSTRAIAPVVGVDQKTVVRDIAREAHASPQTPSPVPRGEAGSGEGQTSDAPRPTGAEADAATSEVQSARVESAPTPRPTVTGRDGKTYTRPAPTQQRATRRAPLTDYARDAAYDLEKVAEKLQRVLSDDRFTDNRDVIAERTSGQIGRSIELIAQFRNALQKETTP